jgi:hypothetical protein
MRRQNAPAGGQIFPETRRPLTAGGAEMGQIGEGNLAANSWDNEAAGVPLKDAWTTNGYIRAEVMAADRIRAKIPWPAYESGGSLP